MQLASMPVATLPFYMIVYTFLSPEGGISLLAAPLWLPSLIAILALQWVAGLAGAAVVRRFRRKARFLAIRPVARGTALGVAAAACLTLLFAAADASLRRRGLSSGLGDALAAALFACVAACLVLGPYLGSGEQDLSV